MLLLLCGVKDIIIDKYWMILYSDESGNSIENNLKKKWGHWFKGIFWSRIRP